MPRFSITLDDDLTTLADTEARRTRTSRASVVRRAMESYLMGGEGRDFSDLVEFDRRKQGDDDDDTSA